MGKEHLLESGTYDAYFMKLEQLMARLDKQKMNEVLAKRAMCGLFTGFVAGYVAVIITAYYYEILI